MAKVTCTFSMDTEQDKDLVVWLNEQRNRSQAIREALRAGLSPSLSLVDIRRVVKVAISEALQGVVLAQAQVNVEDDPELVELNHNLDTLFDGW